MTQQGFALFFDTNIGFFELPHGHYVDFEDGLVKKTQRLFNKLFIYLYYETAKQLVKVVVELVSFAFADFNRELHGIRPFIRARKSGGSYCANSDRGQFLIIMISRCLKPMQSCPIGAQISSSARSKQIRRAELELCAPGDHSRS